jgi:hypothetical protein
MDGFLGVWGQALETKWIEEFKDIPSDVAGSSGAIN